MRLIITFVHRYPIQSLFTLIATLLAGISEGFGISMLVPLLGIAMGAPGSLGASHRSGSAMEGIITGFLTATGMPSTLGVMLFIFVVSIMLKAILVLLANKQVGYMVARVATDLRLALIGALFATRWEYYVNQPVGRFTNAFATEAKRSSDAFLYGIRAIAFSLHAVIYAIVALLLGWKITLITLGAGILILYVLRRLVTKAKKAGAQQTRLLKSLLSLLTDTLQSIKPLKSMARENEADSVLQRETKQLNAVLQKQVFSEEALRALQEPLVIIFFAFGLYVALVWWQLPLAKVIIMVYMLAKTLKTLQKAQKEYQSMVIAESAYWSLMAKIKEAENERETSVGTLLPTFTHSIRFEAVSFSYGDRFVLKNISLSFPKGSFSVIIGASGAGKTTLIDLITGLLGPQAGKLWIDDIPLSTVDIKAWRHMIGYVPQESLLLHDSVFMNVTLGDPSLTEKDVAQALQNAGALRFVAEMPHGIHSSVGEKGARLSGGQRQRITIARALVHRPELLILDEATSSLDPDSEAAICATLYQLRGKLTIISISHQKALLHVADRGYRLTNGVVEVLEKKCM
ncbi:MAG: ATP-binding cassette domain-containing protein [Desulfobacterales bacterium]|jgi:ATP-binding cassette subfamily C protein|nr:ATP-binding cassette domain-containing protein [Desulfobacterales bacterium]